MMRRQIITAIFVACIMLLIAGCSNVSAPFQKTVDLSAYNLSICEKLYGNSKGDNRDACYSQLAANYNATEICTKLDLDKRNRCYQLISWEYETVEPCAYMTNERQPDTFNRNGGDYFRDGCYSYYASLYTDVSYCDNMEEDEFKASCFVTFAKDGLDAKRCQTIKSKSYSETCITNTAKKLLKQDVCGYLDTDIKRGYCYIDVASKGNSTTDCNRIFELEWPEPGYAYRQERVELCYREVAFNTLDVKNCENITAPTNVNKQYCIDEVKGRIRMNNYRDCSLDPVCAKKLTDCQKSYETRMEDCESVYSN